MTGIGDACVVAKAGFPRGGPVKLTNVNVDDNAEPVDATVTARLRL